MKKCKKKNRIRCARTNPIKAYIRKVCREEIDETKEKTQISENLKKLEKKLNKLSEELIEVKKKKIHTWEYGTITEEEAYRKIMVEISRIKRDLREFTQRDT